MSWLGGASILAGLLYVAYVAWPWGGIPILIALIVLFVRS